MPELIEAISSADHEIGGCYEDEDECGRYTAYDCKPNTFTYEEDGWFVEVKYCCTGEYDDFMGDYWNPPYCELKRAWGTVTDLYVSYIDEATGEETVFSDEDLKELRDMINAVLEDIA